MAHITPGQGTVGVGVGAGSRANIEPTAAAIVLSASVTGDTSDRFTIGADGKLSWGPGNGATDIFLSRSGVNVLNFSGEVDAVGFFSSLSDIYSQRNSATQVAIGAMGPGGTSGIRFQSGEAGANLYRSAAGTLACDGGLRVAGVLTGNYGASQIQLGASVAPSLGTSFNSGGAAGAGSQGGVLSFGTGAPANASGANGDIYLRVDGAALTTIYQRRAGAWVGIV